MFLYGGNSGEIVIKYEYFFFDLKLFFALTHFIINSC